MRLRERHTRKRAARRNSNDLVEQVAIDTPRVRVTFVDMGRSGSPAVKFVGSDIEVPSAIVTGLHTFFAENDKALAGLDISIEPRNVDGMLADLARAVKVMVRSKGVTLSQGSEKKSLRFKGTDIEYVKAGDGDMQLEVTPTPDLRLSSEERDVVARAMQLHGPSLRGYRIRVTPQSSSGRVYTRNVVAALERLAHAEWEARTAGRRAPLSSDELAELRELAQRRYLTVQLGGVSVPESDAEAALMRPLFERLKALEEQVQAQRQAARSVPAGPVLSVAEQRAAVEKAMRAEAAAERAAEIAAVAARRAEIAEFKEDTRTGPRAKMPPALEVGRLVQGPGAGFTIRDDAPRMDQGRYCGNPIDGKAYYFLVSRQSRAASVYVRRTEVENQAAAAGVRPDYTKRTFPIRQSVDRDTLVADAVRAGPPRPPGVSAGPPLDPREQRLLASWAYVRIPSRSRDFVPPGTRISLTRAESETGLEVLILLPSIDYLRKLEAFVTNTMIPAEAKRLFWSTELPTHVGREKTTAKARRGLKPPGGILRPKGLRQPTSVFDRAAMIAERPTERMPPEAVEGGVWDPVAEVWTFPGDDAEAQAELQAAQARHAETVERMRKLVRAELSDAQSVTPRAMEEAKRALQDAERNLREAQTRADYVRSRVAAHPQLEEGKAFDPRTGRLHTSSAKLKRSVRWHARRAEVESDEFIKLHEGKGGRASKPKKAATATSRGDINTDFAVFDPETGRYKFLRRSKKAALALAQMEEMRPFARQDFMATTAGPVFQALAGSSGGTVDPGVAARLAMSGCLRVNDAVVTSPAHPTEVGAKITIQCEPKNTSPFFSWVRTTLPPDVNTTCITFDLDDASVTKEQRIAAHSLAQEQGFSVYVTYNPVLFELTRQMWASRRTRTRAPWETFLGQPRMLQDIDTVGRYGNALHVMQSAAVSVPPGKQQQAIAAALAPALNMGLTKGLVNGSTPQAKVFMQFWPFGATFERAKENFANFVLDPPVWLRQIKTQEVDVAVPRLMRAAQIGVPKRKAVRLRVSSPQEELQAALYTAMKGAPPGGPVREDAARKLLEAFQASPPRYMNRASSGLMEAVVPDALEVTGEFDAPTVALLNRILNAPQPLPRGATPVPPALTLVGTTPARIPGVTGLPSTEEQHQAMSLLRQQIAEIDRAIAALGPPPYQRKSIELARSGALDLRRAGLKRKARSFDD